MTVKTEGDPAQAVREFGEAMQRWFWSLTPYYRRQVIRQAHPGISEQNLERQTRHPRDFTEAVEWLREALIDSGLRPCRF